MFSKEEINGRYQKEIKGFEKFRIGVSCAIIEDGRLLLEKRSDCGWWGLIGGRLEIGETAEKCVIREVFEETGLELKSNQLELFSIYSDPRDGRVLQYPDNRVHLIDITFVCKFKIKNIKISHESLEISSFKIEEIPKEIVPPSVRIINDLSKYIRQ